MNLARLLVKSARPFAARPAVSVGHEPRFSYGELARRAAALGGALRDRFGFAPGDRVVLAMTNCAAYYEALFGVWHAGLAAVPVNAKLHPREHAYILGDSGARLVLATPALAEALAPAAAGIEGLEAVLSVEERDYLRMTAGEPAAPWDRGRADDLAWLFYTSGTTGRPKGAMLTHRNLLMMTLSYFADIDPVAPEDSMIHAAPMSHGSGLYGLPHIAKGANNVIPASGGFDPAETLALIEAHRGATMFFAPTMVTRLIDSPAIGATELGNLKTIVYGGGPMYVEDLLRALDRLGPRLAQIYGQGESPMTITALSKAVHADSAHPRYRQRLASAGVARTDVEVMVADAEGRPLATGESGEVLVRGAVVMAGYWRNEAASAEALRGGWLHTGDVGSLDEDGFLTLKDRAKDLIVSGGANIYPREVEEVLLKHPDVREVSVVGRPHPEWGEEVVAFVVPHPGRRVAEAELDALCLDHIARFKRPRAYRFLDELPTNNYGKVLKTELRRLLEDRPPPPIR